MNYRGLCLNVLHAAEGPIHIRELASLILTGKGLDPLDRTPRCTGARDCLLHLRRKGVV